MEKVRTEDVATFLAWLGDDAHQDLDGIVRATDPNPNRKLRGRTRNPVINSLFIFYTEGYEFHIYAPYVRMIAQKYAEYGVHNMHPNTPTLTIDLPFHAWMVQAATTSRKTHALIVPTEDNACLTEDTASALHSAARSGAQGRPSLLRLTRMVNLATYTHDTVLLTTSYATLRARLLSATYDPIELLEVVRRILLTDLLRARAEVCESLEGYLQHIVEESGDEKGAFMTAFNLGQVWWEEVGGK